MQYQPQNMGAKDYLALENWDFDRFSTYAYSLLQYWMPIRRWSDYAIVTNH